MRIRKALSVPAVLLSLSVLTPALGEKTAQQIIQDANRLLAEGSYLEASRAYGEAIEIDPHSYSSYYKRATAYLSMGRHGSALDDFDTILRLNPSFSQAHYQKAKILAKQGDFEIAQTELNMYAIAKTDPEAEELSQAVTIAAGAAKSAAQSSKKKRWSECVEQTTKALEVGPNSGDLRQLRIDCATEMGDLDIVYADLTRLAALNPSNVDLSIRLSQISYFLLGAPTASSHIKQCLHYDPDSKPCKKIHRLLRSLEKETTKARNFVEGSTWRQAIKILDGPDGLLAKFEGALEDASTPSKEEPFLPPQFHPREKSQMKLELYALACKAAVGANDLKKDKGMRWCEEVLKMDENHVDGLVGRGERLLKDEKWEEAARTFERAFENGGRSSQDIMNRIQKAQKLLKVSKQKDYYKVLGVPRDADERTIKKAFRTKARKAHPDVGGSEDEMAALNEAYEVLSDEELRTRYDNGDDPNDPTGGRGGNPFQHHGGVPFMFQQGGFSGGGFPFPGGQGGGRKFQFHFGG